MHKLIIHVAALATLLGMLWIVGVNVYWLHVPGEPAAYPPPPAFTARPMVRHPPFFEPQPQQTGRKRAPAKPVDMTEARGSWLVLVMGHLDHPREDRYLRLFYRWVDHASTQVWFVQMRSGHRSDCVTQAEYDANPKDKQSACYDRYFFWNKNYGKGNGLTHTVIAQYWLGKAIYGSSNFPIVRLPVIALVDPSGTLRGAWNPHTGPTPYPSDVYERLLALQRQAGLAVEPSPTYRADMQPAVPGFWVWLRTKAQPALDALDRGTLWLIQ